MPRTNAPNQRPARHMLSAQSLREGACLCGSVRVSLPGDVDSVGACHCDMCRRWTSSPWMALRAPPGTMLVGETVRVFQSSALAERGFCAQCGSALFHRPKDGPELAVSAGLFDPIGLKFTREIFFDRKPAFYSFADQTIKRSTLVMALAWAPRLIWRGLLASLRRRPA